MRGRRELDNLLLSLQPGLNRVRVKDKDKDNRVKAVGVEGQIEVELEPEGVVEVEGDEEVVSRVDKLKRHESRALSFELDER